MQEIKDNWNTFKNNILLDTRWLYYIACIIIAYGYNLFSRTVSMDDLAYTYFFGKSHGMVAGMRWGLESLNLFLPSNYTPFIERFYSVILMMLSSVLLSFYVFVLTKEDKKVWPYIVLSSMYSTYPLINESWEFFSFLYYPFFISVVLIVMILQRHLGFSKKTFLFYGMILSLVMAGGEDVVPVYILLVFLTLYQNERSKDIVSNWFVEGLKYAAPLFIALFFREIIGFSLIKLLNLKYSPVGNYNIVWISQGYKEAINSILYNGWYFVIRGLSYFPITEFIIALLLHLTFAIYDSVRYKNISFMIIALFAVLSIFSLSIIQGEYLHYRNAQPVYIYVAVMAYYVMIRAKLKKIIYCVVCVMLLFVGIKQSVYLHELLALNNLRSENEMAVFSNIGYRLYSEFDTSKKVIFCGEYQLGSFIENQIVVKEGSLAKNVEDWLRDVLNKKEGRLYQEFVCTNINSYYNTQSDAFEGQIMIKNYLSYLGYDIKVLENLSREEENFLKHGYEKIAISEGLKTYDIKDMGDYILVFMGPTIDGINSD